MVLFSAWGSAVALLVTTGLLYILAAQDDTIVFFHVSGILSSGCPVTLASRFGNFGYSIAYALLAISFRSVYTRDHSRLFYYVGLFAILSMFLVLFFPSGVSRGSDIVHYFATAGLILGLLVYTFGYLDLRRQKAVAFIQNGATLMLFLSSIAMFTTAVVGEWNRPGWNGFVVSQLLFLFFFVVFLFCWGTTR